MNNQKGIAILGLLIIILVLAAIGAGVYLVQHPQILRSRASTENIVFQSTQGQPLPIDPTQNLPVTNSISVKVNINVPSK